MTVARWRWGDPVEALAMTLKRGGMLAIPTESSYGLAVDPTNEAAVESVFTVKGRDARKPLPVVVADLEQAAQLGADLGDPGLQAVARHWPAPLAIVVALARPLPAAAGSGRLAIRVPAHARLRRLLAALGPLTATSANHAGEVPLTDVDGVAEMLAGRDAVLVDEGSLAGGAPSTMVSWTDGALRILRQGSYSLAVA